MPRKLTPATTLENLKKEAKRWLKALRENNRQARERLKTGFPKAPERAVLRDVQHALACEYGMRNWMQLRQAVQAAAAEHQAAGSKLRTAAEYQQAAQDFVKAYEGDAESLARFNRHYGRVFSSEDLRAEIWRRVYAFRQRSSRVPKNYLKLEEAQIVVAQDAGFGSWDALMQAVAAGTPPVAAYAIDRQANRAAPRRRMTDAEWDELIGLMKEHRVTALGARGLMTDEVLARIAALDHITRLNLG